ncbi:hypothetical protein BO85DRAFT_482566 [Aspergillus piperis CBS 112811]|uniref:Uncharacterized protein n=1 Tax=Aspergillus piperis CBS 112811 TaxID=1448313 RepID=A0A8G1VR96_9EURO|nr:hypothetical protein BO85DRAFT_482566 [Aspergillus piperis CBS 112811]RAH62676.1 hypothetical protein BO85DRAFT_482566 [Aspergillus piperis CBS 112811]
MKRLNSNKDDNVPIYIYILLVVILSLSFLGTYLDSTKRVNYLPGHIHAFYLEYVYYANRNAGTGEAPRRAPGVYSERIQRGGNHHTTYGTIP